MPAILGALAILAGAYVWYLRYQNARDAAETLVDAANDVRLAARRFGFRRKANVHPVDCVEDGRLGALAIAAAMMQMDHAWTREAEADLARAAETVFAVKPADAAEMVVFAKWLSDQSSTYDEIVRRLAKRLAGLGDRGLRQDLARLIEGACTDENGELSDNAVDALNTVNRHLR